MCDTDSTNFLLAEYTGLRDEIVKRIEIQHQLISFAVVASGGFLSLVDKLPAKVFLAYSILALFLSAAWSQSDIRIQQIGRYIKDKIEKRLLDEKGGWELHHQLSTGKNRVTLSRVISIGIFAGTQGLTVALFFVKRGNVTDFTGIEILLLSMSVLMIIVTLILLCAARKLGKMSG